MKRDKWIDHTTIGFLGLAYLLLYTSQAIIVIIMPRESEIEVIFVLVIIKSQFWLEFY